MQLVQHSFCVISELNLAVSCQYWQQCVEIQQLSAYMALHAAGDDQDDEDEPLPVHVLRGRAALQRMDARGAVRSRNMSHSQVEGQLRRAQVTLCVKVLAGLKVHAAWVTSETAHL